MQDCKDWLEITGLQPVSIILSLEDLSDKKGFKVILKVAISLQNSSSSCTGYKLIKRYTFDDLDFFLGDKDPNAPIISAIPGIQEEAIIPNVNSWHELITEATTPCPRFWQDPYTGKGQATATGGICTQNFEVRSSPLINVAAVCGVSLTSLLSSFSWTNSFLSKQKDRKEKISQFSPEIEAILKENPYEEGSVQTSAPSERIKKWQ